MIARGSHNFTCHPLTKHTCLYSPAAGSEAKPSVQAVLPIVPLELKRWWFLHYIGCVSCLAAAWSQLLTRKLVASNRVRCPVVVTIIMWAIVMITITVHKTKCCDKVAMHVIRDVKILCFWKLIVGYKKWLFLIIIIAPCCQQTIGWTVMNV